MPRRIIDCTKPMQHGLNKNFVAHEFERAGEPRTIAHRIQMESDVGTHVVAGRRFASWGSAIGDLRVDTFFGEGTVNPDTVTSVTMLVGAWIVGDSLRETTIPVDNTGE